MVGSQPTRGVVADHMLDNKEICLPQGVLYHAFLLSIRGNDVEDNTLNRRGNPELYIDARYDGVFRGIREVRRVFFTIFVDF